MISLTSSFRYYLFLSSFLLLLPFYANSSAVPVDLPNNHNAVLDVKMSNGVIVGVDVKKGTAANDNYNAANDEYIKDKGVTMNYSNSTKQPDGSRVEVDKGRVSVTGKIIAANAFANLSSAISTIVNSPAVRDAASAAVEAASAGDAAAAAAHAGGAAANAAAAVLLPNSVQQITSSVVEGSVKSVQEDKKNKEEEVKGANFLWRYTKLLPNGAYADWSYVFAKASQEDLKMMSTIASGDPVGFKNDLTGFSSMVDNSERKISGVSIVAMSQKEIEDFLKKNPDVLAPKDVMEEIMKNMDKTLDDIKKNTDELKDLIAQSVATGSVPSVSTTGSDVTAPLSDGASTSLSMVSPNKATVSSKPGSKADSVDKSSEVNKAGLELESPAPASSSICTVIPWLCDTSVDEPEPLPREELQTRDFDVNISVACPDPYSLMVDLGYNKFMVNIPLDEYCEKAKIIKPFLIFLSLIISVGLYLRWVN